MDQPIVGSDAENKLIAILKILTRLEANGYYPLDKAIIELDPFIPDNSTLIVITLDQDEQVLRSIESLIYNHNLSLIDVLLTASSFDQSLPAAKPYSPQVKNQSVAVYQIKSGQNLETAFSEKLA